jgi:HEAT repeat protein
MKILASILLAVIATVTVDVMPGQAQQPSDIRAFVHQVYIEGVPYEEAIRFDADTAVPILLDMLADPKEEDYWPNIVITLGMLGDERAVEPLIKFLEQEVPTGRLSRSHYIAKTGVVMALGYLINKSKSQKALTYLTDSVRPNIWKERKLSWTSPDGEAEARDLQLSKMAILGLALSGHPSAAEILRSLQKPAKTEIEKRFQDRVRAVVAEALSAHKTISAEGLVSYDRKRRR